jgi:hypothetical protein
MKWLKELFADLWNEIRNALAQLKRGETWLGLGLIALFGLLTYIIGQFAFRTDSVLKYLHQTVGACRELSNGPIIFLFCGMMFFLLAVVATFGEFQRYCDCRRRNGFYEARQAKISAILWCAVAIAISISALFFFYNFCL